MTHLPLHGHIFGGWPCTSWQGAYQNVPSYVVNLIAWHAFIFLIFGCGPLHVDAASRSVWAARELKKSSPRLPHLLAACMWNLHVPSTHPYEAVDLLPMVQQAAGAPPILGQLYLPRDSYVLSATLGVGARSVGSSNLGEGIRAGRGGDEAASPGHPLSPSTCVQGSWSAAKSPGPQRRWWAGGGLAPAPARETNNDLHSLENATWLFDWGLFHGRIFAFMGTSSGAWPRGAPQKLPGPFPKCAFLHNNCHCHELSFIFHFFAFLTRFLYLPFKKQINFFVEIPLQRRVAILKSACFFLSWPPQWPKLGRGPL